MKVENLEKKMNRQEQYSWQNYILIHGSKEKKNKRTYDSFLELFREELNEDALSVDLYRTHKIEQNTETNNKPCRTILKFARYIILQSF